MKWNDFVEKEIQWLQERATASEDPILRSWFGVMVDAAKVVQVAPMGHSHNESHRCSCGHDHSAEEEKAHRQYFYHLLSDPVLSMPVGYAAYDPGVAGLEIKDLRKIMDLHRVPSACLSAPVVVSSSDKAQDLCAQSTHPLKKKLPIKTWSYGHMLFTVFDGVICIDRATQNRFEQLSSVSVLFRKMGLPKGYMEVPEEGLHLFGLAQM